HAVRCAALTDWESAADCCRDGELITAGDYYCTVHGRFKHRICVTDRIFTGTQKPEEISRERLGISGTSSIYRWGDRFTTGRTRRRTHRMAARFRHDYMQHICTRYFYDTRLEKRSSEQLNI